MCSFCKYFGRCFISDPLGLFYSVFFCCGFSPLSRLGRCSFSLLGLLLFAPHIFDLSAFILLYDTNHPIGLFFSCLRLLSAALCVLLLWFHVYVYHITARGVKPAAFFVIDTYKYFRDFCAPLSLYLQGVASMPGDKTPIVRGQNSYS